MFFSLWSLSILSEAFLFSFHPFKVNLFSSRPHWRKRLVTGRCGAAGPEEHLDDFGREAWECLMRLSCNVMMALLGCGCGIPIPEWLSDFPREESVGAGSAGLLSHTIVLRTFSPDNLAHQSVSYNPSTVVWDATILATWQAANQTPC